MKIVAIDPSVNHIGIAWKAGDSNFQWTELQPKNIPDDELGSRRQQVARLLRLELCKYNLHDADVGIIEYPNFQASARGLISATKGYTFDLAFLAGVVSSFMPKTRWLMPTPIQWKGNLPKEAIGVRFTILTGFDYRDVSDHCYEATMMIDWFLKKKL